MMPNGDSHGSANERKDDAALSIKVQLHAEDLGQDDRQPRTAAGERFCNGVVEKILGLDNRARDSCMRETRALSLVKLSLHCRFDA